MCFSSAITRTYQQEWTPSWQVITPGIITTTRVITEADWNEYQRLKKNAEELDQKTGQPNCDEADKVKWEEEMLKVVKRVVQDELRRGVKTS